MNLIFFIFHFWHLFGFLQSFCRIFWVITKHHRKEKEKHFLEFRWNLEVNEEKSLKKVVSTDIDIYLLRVRNESAPLTFSWLRSLWYRNQSIDLLWKSMDWFLYHRYLRHERVNRVNFILNIYSMMIFSTCCPLICQSHLSKLATLSKYVWSLSRHQSLKI